MTATAQVRKVADATPASSRSRSTSAGSSPASSAGGVSDGFQSPTPELPKAVTSALPSIDYPSPQLEAAMAQARADEPCFGTRDFLLNGFFHERKVQSCPASGIGAPPGLESGISQEPLEAKDPFDDIFNTASDYGSWVQEHGAFQQPPLMPPCLPAWHAACLAGGFEAAGGPAEQNTTSSAQSRSTSVGSSRVASSAGCPAATAPAGPVNLTAEQFAALTCCQDDLKRQNAELLARIEQLEAASRGKGTTEEPREPPLPSPVPSGMLDGSSQEQIHVPPVLQSEQKARVEYYNIGDKAEDAAFDDIEADNIFNTSSDYGSWGQDGGALLPPLPLTSLQMPFVTDEAAKVPPPPPAQPPVLPAAMATAAAVRTLQQSVQSVPSGIRMPPPPPAEAPVVPAAPSASPLFPPLQVPFVTAPTQQPPTAVPGFSPEMPPQMQAPPMAAPYLPPPELQAPPSAAPLLAPQEMHPSPVARPLLPPPDMQAPFAAPAMAHAPPPAQFGPPAPPPFFAAPPAVPGPLSTVPLTAPPLPQPAAPAPCAAQPAPAEVGSARCPTVGSARHFCGGCKPCAFFHTKGCESGVDCEFCHLCWPGEKKRRQRDKYEAGRIRSYLWRTAVAEAYAAQAAAQAAAMPGQYPAAFMR